GGQVVVKPVHEDKGGEVVGLPDGQEHDPGPLDLEGGLEPHDAVALADVTHAAEAGGQDHQVWRVHPVVAQLLGGQNAVAQHRVLFSGEEPVVGPGKVQAGAAHGIG